MPEPVNVCSIGLLLLTITVEVSSVNVYSKEVRSSPFSDMELFEKVTKNGEQPTLLSGESTAKGLARTVTGRVVVAEQPTLFIAFKVMV